MATYNICCGFECGTFGEGNLPPHINGGTISNVDFDTGTVRSGARSLKVTLVSGQTSRAQSRITIGQQVVRVYVRFESLPDASCYVCHSQATGNDGCYFDSSDSKLYARSGTTQGATGFGPVTTDVWYRLDLSISTQQNPHTTKLQVDGTAVSDAVDARASATGPFNLGTNASHSATSGVFYFDDWLQSSQLADYPLGAGYINHFVPIADGTHNTEDAANAYEFGDGVDIVDATTTSYTMVDDVPMPSSGSTDRIQYRPNTGVNTRYVEHIFGPAPGISVPTEAPLTAIVMVCGEEAGTQGNDSTWKIVDDGTEVVIEARANSGVTTLRYYSVHFNTMPKDSAAWTVARFNALRHRWGYVSDANPDVYFESAMIEAAFAEAAPPAGNVPEKMNSYRQRRVA
jgi:hypothetical protein